MSAVCQETNKMEQHLLDAFFRGDNGKRYLLCESPFGAEDTCWIQHLTAYAYDKTGRLIAEEEVFWQEWGSAE